MISRLAAYVILTLIGIERLAANEVILRRVPHGGFKASAATDESGTVHLIYFTGEPSGGDAWYVSSKDGGTTYSKPVQVNGERAGVLGTSSARGPHLALGRNGRVHAIWMGAVKGADYRNTTFPLLYAALDPAKGSFSPARNLITKTNALDGDSSLAADAIGNVYVVFHAQLPTGKGEADRGVWIARSTDDGATFSEERNILPEKTGVCPCCGVTAQSGPNGTLAILYRAATDKVHRGMRLLRSSDRGESFELSALDEWKLSMCPMSTGSLLSTGNGFIGAWENDGQIGFARLSGANPQKLKGAAPRKHPTLTTNSKGETLLAWTEGVAFGKGGEVGWQRFDATGKPAGEVGRAEGLPGHGNVAAVALLDGTFALFY
ncbi:MAG TPA: sialidase family protein [Chthoniobacteraceae bacterium]|nr:sialidase family protein [Chthoniobacteraceae bacterium]